MKPPVFLLFLGNPMDGVAVAARYVASEGRMISVGMRDALYTDVRQRFLDFSETPTEAMVDPTAPVIPEWGMTAMQIVAAVEQKMREIHPDVWTRSYTAIVGRLLAAAGSPDPRTQAGAGAAVQQLLGSVDARVAGDWLRCPRFTVSGAEDVASVNLARTFFPGAVVHVVLVTRDADTMPAWMAALPGDVFASDSFHVLVNADDDAQFGANMDALLDALNLRVAPTSPLS